MKTSSEIRQQVGPLEYEHRRPICRLCDCEDRLVYRGLATLGIEYPGDTRFICDVCVVKVKQG